MSFEQQEGAAEGDLAANEKWLKSELAGLKESEAALRAEVDRLRAEVQLLRFEAANQAAWLRTIYDSWSWRLTAPLRVGPLAFLNERLGLKRLLHRPDRAGAEGAVVSGPAAGAGEAGGFSRRAFLLRREELADRIAEGGEPDAPSD